MNGIGARHGNTAPRRIGAWRAARPMLEGRLQRSRIAASPNTVHFRILMAAAKSIQVVGWGTRGRSL